MHSKSLACPALPGSCRGCSAFVVFLNMDAVEGAPGATQLKLPCLVLAMAAWARLKVPFLLSEVHACICKTSVMQLPQLTTCNLATSSWLARVPYQRHHLQGAPEWHAGHDRMHLANVPLPLPIFFPFSCIWALCSTSQRAFSIGVTQK